MDNRSVKAVDELKAELVRRSHPAANVFPLLIDKDPVAWGQLCSDVRTNGLHNPILTDRPVTEVGWLILDGRNRELICLMHDIAPKYEVVNLSDDAAVMRVISANLHRRHDDASVRAQQLAKLLEMLEVENFPVPPVPQAAAAAGISDRTLWDAKRLLKEDAELADQVAKGNISGHAARAVVSALPAGPDREGLKKRIAATGSKKKVKRMVREVRRGMKHHREEVLKMPCLTGEYSTLLAVVKNVPRLPSVLRNLKDDLKPLSVGHARELRTGIEGVKTLDRDELLKAVDVAVEALDRHVASPQRAADVELEPL